MNFFSLWTTAQNHCDMNKKIDFHFQNGQFKKKHNFPAPPILNIILRKCQWCGSTNMVIIFLELAEMGNYSIFCFFVFGYWVVQFFFSMSFTKPFIWDSIYLGLCQTFTKTQHTYSPDRQWCPESIHTLNRL